MIDLSTISGRLDDQTLDLLQEIADAPLPAPASCTEEHFLRCMKSLDILPRRADDSGGALRLKLYRAKLSGYSDDALSYLVSKGLEQFHFFPSIAECVKLLATFPNREVAESRRGRAKVLLQGEMQARLNETLAQLEARALDQSAIDALPAKIKRIAGEKGYLWVWPDGRFTVRVDIFTLPPEQQEAEREKNRAMFAEWEQIEAARAAEKEAGADV